ncbi:MAG TPA: AarF/ABC1/UbiB kinase family protein [Ktedonobacteraceae bacterium]|nr:AarF/ABC1/UbiB kinase family protein [Ktedonobacteraceae bacterium]
MRRKTPRINRFSQMVRFFRVSRLLLWTLWVIYRERRRVIRARERGNYEVQPDVEVLINVLVAFRHTAVKLGVLMIKLGQFLSSRADLLPERALEVLSALQDEVPPESFDHVVSVIESELGKPVEQVFSVVERKAAAAASLGQVHKAVLVATGEEVAVKVQRPHIEQLVRSDLSTIKFVIWIINRLVDTREFIDLMGVYREFKRTIYEEIDYVTEAANARRFKEMFKDDPAIYIPRVYEEYTTRRVLVLEWINGIKINDYAALDAAGIDKLEVAKRTVRAYFHQFFEAGFFHADPHPGNIFIKKGPPEVGPIIEFVDFGMVGSLTRSMKKALRDLFVSFVLRDSRALVDALRRLGFIGEGANLVAIERGLSMMLDQYYGMTLGEARQLDIPEVGEDVGRLLYGQPFHIPAQFAFTGRAVSTLVGVATGLAPEFNFVDVATPYARRFLNINAQGARQTVEQLVRQLTEAGTILMRLPREVEQLVSKIDAGQIEVKADLGLPHARGRGRRSRGVGEGIGGMASTVAFAVSLGGGILLTNAHQVMAGWFFMGMAALMGLRLLIRR